MAKVKNLHRIVIASGVRVYRDGLARDLDATTGLTVVGVAAEDRAVCALVRDMEPDVLLLDLAMHGAASLVRAVRGRHPHLPVIALAVPETERDVLAAVQAGATAYTPPSASLEDVRATIRAAANGEAICSPRMTGTLLRTLAERASTGIGEDLEPTRLTRREIEVLALIDEGCTNKEIARRLTIEVPTVKNHVHHLLEKLGVHRREDAAQRARRFTSVDVCVAEGGATSRR